MSKHYQLYHFAGNAADGALIANQAFADYDDAWAALCAAAATETDLQPKRPRIDAPYTFIAPQSVLQIWEVKTPEIL